MDETALQVLRIFGYLLNMALFASIAIKYPHHKRVMFGWILWAGIAIFAVLVRLRGHFANYLLVVDYGLTFTLYLNAVLTAWVLVRRNGKK